MQRPEAMLDVTVSLWQSLAFELVAIIGEGGFQSLYARSIHLSNATFPWLTSAHPVQEIDSRFAGLKQNLEAEELAQAGEASITLLITFVDILAVLIGERLTASILLKAWGDDASNIAAKELQ